MNLKKNKFNIKSIEKLFPIIILLLISCFPKPRNIDWKNEWINNENKLKLLAEYVQLDSTGEYNSGNFDYPNSFNYPFDQGFYVNKTNEHLTIKFYLDRGIVDHYSAFIYTNDSVLIKTLNNKTQKQENDFKIENHWDIIND